MSDTITNTYALQRFNIQSESYKRKKAELDKKFFTPTNGRYNVEEYIDLSIHNERNHSLKNELNEIPTFFNTNTSSSPIQDITSTTETSSRIFGNLTHQTKQGEYLFKNTKLTDEDICALSVTNDEIDQELSKLNDTKTDKMSSSEKIKLAQQKLNLEKFKDAITFLSSDHSIDENNAADFERQLTEARQTIFDFNKKNMPSNIRELINDESVDSALKNLSEDNAFKTDSKINDEEITITSLTKKHQNKETQKAREKQEKDALWKNITEGNFNSVEKFDDEIKKFRDNNGIASHNGKYLSNDQIGTIRRGIDLKERRPENALKAIEKAIDQGNGSDEQIRKNLMALDPRDWDRALVKMDANYVSRIYEKLTNGINDTDSMKYIIENLAKNHINSAGTTTQLDFDSTQDYKEDDFEVVLNELRTKAQKK